MSIRKLLNQNSFVTFGILVIVMVLLWSQLEELTTERIIIFSLIIALFHYIQLHLLVSGSPVSRTRDLRNLLALNNRPTIIEVYSNFSIACLFALPILDMLENNLGEEADVIRIDAQTGDGAKMAARLGVDLVPTFIVLSKYGKEKWRKVGLAGCRMLQSQIEALLLSMKLGIVSANRIDGDCTRVDWFTWR